jgi:hypothetical protein
MLADLQGWLRRRKPTRIVLQPSGKEWPRPTVRPWAQLAELGADSETVEAYSEGSLVGVWRRRDELAARRAAAPAPAPAAPSTEVFRAELDGLRALVRMQHDMLREVITAQALALRAVRSAASVSGPDEGEADDGDGELDGLLGQVLRNKLGPDAANGSTSDMLRAVLAAGVGPKL